MTSKSSWKPRAINAPWAPSRTPQRHWRLCGEGACFRSVAQRPQHLSAVCRIDRSGGLRAATLPNGSKLPRHKGGSPPLVKCCAYTLGNGAKPASTRGLRKQKKYTTDRITRNGTPNTRVILKASVNTVVIITAPISTSPSSVL